ncbi:protein PIGBOS1 [Hyla sarda]|uniref:protein PIGBOS1 n=1 Tax=Hyla sarda TaxID=327740 RepID=UPI0024C3ED8B|nr:protein PIGBOS1 [Hyla sarda]XP_056428348.1 protein PIGBOS1 [Hyla sarda]
MNHRLPFGQLFLALLLGVGGGIYIYKPLFEQYRYEQKAVQADSNTTDEKKENK